MGPRALGWPVGTDILCRTGPSFLQDELHCWWVIREALYVDPSEATFALVEVWVARVPFTPEAYESWWVEFFWC